VVGSINFSHSAPHGCAFATAFPIALLLLATVAHVCSRLHFALRGNGTVEPPQFFDVGLLPCSLHSAILLSTTLVAAPLPMALALSNSSPVQSYSALPNLSAHSFPPPPSDQACLAYARADRPASTLPPHTFCWVLAPRLSSHAGPDAGSAITAFLPPKVTVCTFSFARFSCTTSSTPVKLLASALDFCLTLKFSAISLSPSPPLFLIKFDVFLPFFFMPYDLFQPLHFGLFTISNIHTLSLTLPPVTCVALHLFLLAPRVPSLFRPPPRT